jgi:hypothetical protein
LTLGYLIRGGIEQARLHFTIIRKIDSLLPAIFMSIATREVYTAPGSPHKTNIGASIPGAIQMHVYLMLRELDPPAAQNLCNALKRSFWDEDIWSYYAKSSDEF